MSGTDSTFLEQQYRTADNLQARIAVHERFSTNPQPFPDWVFEHLGFPADAEILEVGCGNANLWAVNLERIPPGWQLTLTDLSDGMVEEARRRLGDRATYGVANVEALPFAGESFDAVIANHMLFHVPDRSRAFTEISRVLRPFGVVIATTNGRDHLRELWALAGGREGGSWSDRFSLENGSAQLEQFFAGVDVERFLDALEITEIEPLIGFVQSLRAEGQDVANLASQAERAIALDGSFHVTKSTGLFRAYKH